MNNEKVWQEILAKKVITTKDRILFRTIQDVLSAVFTDKNHISILKVGYKITEELQAWFPNISPNDKKANDISNGYAIYISEDWNTLYKYNKNKTIEQRKNQAEKLNQNNVQFITFAKILEKSKGIGYHFIGIFIFDKFLDQELKTMIYKKISDNFVIEQWK